MLRYVHTCRAFIFDSLCNGLTPYAMEAINGIQVYLNAISAMAPNLLPCANVPNPLVLDPIPVKVLFNCVYCYRMVAKVCKANNVLCIQTLLVGFMYI